MTPFALISDLDGTLLGDDAALQEFAAWTAARRGGMRLAYATGRFFEMVRRPVMESALPAPDVVIEGVGIAIRDFATGAPWPEWTERLRAAGWDRERLHEFLAAEAPGLTLQPDEFQHEFKLSYYWEGAAEEDIEALKVKATNAGFRFELIYSSGRDLDFLPPGVNKGAAAGMVARRWGLPAQCVIVSGDTGNDITLFNQGFRGIVVANAQPELLALDGPGVHHASRPYAGGVIEGLEHWLVMK